MGKSLEHAATEEEDVDPAEALRSSVGVIAEEEDELELEMRL